MNAISPFSLIEKLGSGKIAGAVADLVADTARDATRPGGPLGKAFSDVWDRLDANDDGRVTGRDALGHAVIAGAWTFNSVGKAMGLEMDRGASGRAAERGAGLPADGLATPAQMMLADGPHGAGASGAPSGASGAAPAHTDISALDAIRAAYRTLQAARA